MNRVWSENILVCILYIFNGEMSMWHFVHYIIDTNYFMLYT